MCQVKMFRLNSGAEEEYMITQINKEYALKKDADITCTIFRHVTISILPWTNISRLKLAAHFYGCRWILILQFEEKKSTSGSHKIGSKLQCASMFKEDE